MFDLLYLSSEGVGKTADVCCRDGLFFLELGEHRGYIRGIPSMPYPVLNQLTPTGEGGGV